MVVLAHSGRRMQPMVGKKSWQLEATTHTEAERTMALSSVSLFYQIEDPSSLQATARI